MKKQVTDLGSLLIKKATHVNLGGLDLYANEHEGLESYGA